MSKNISAPIRTFIVLIIMSLSLSASSQDCSIINPQHLVYNCGNGAFFIDLNFDTANPQDTFRVTANGIIFGSFSYSEFPVSLGPLLINNNDWVVEITDNNIAGCSMNVPVGVVTCAGLCQIVEIDVEKGECNTDGTYPVTVDVTANATSSNFAEVFAYGDTLGTFRIIEGNFLIDSFPANGGLFDTITVCVLGDDQCCLTMSFISEDCTACVILDATAVLSECANGEIFATLDFDYANVGMSGFRVGGNEMEYGTFSYDSLPLEVGPIPVDSGVIYEFIIVDNDNGLCFNFVEAGLASCDSSCIITNVAAVTQACIDDGTFFVEVDFDFLNTDTSGFDLSLNGTVIDSFTYDQLPVMVGPYLGDGISAYEFTARDLGLEQCQSSTTIDSIFCPVVCSMSDLNLMVSECDSFQFNVEIFFNVNNGGANGFSIMGNDSLYGNYAYSDLPIQLGPFNGDTSTVYDFQIQDLDDNTCFIREVLGTVDCFPSSTQNLNPEEFIKVFSMENEIKIQFIQDQYSSQLLNINGQILQNYSKQNEITINRNLHPSGIYLFFINTSRGKIVQKLFL